MKDYWQTAEDIFSHPTGQLALKELWAQSLLLTAMREKDFDIRRVDVRALQEGRRKAVAAANSLNPDLPEDKPLLNMWQSMQDKNQELVTKYYKPDEVKEVTYWND